MRTYQREMVGLVGPERIPEAAELFGSAVPEQDTGGADFAFGLALILGGWRRPSG
ncbi:hypothetical protein GZH49_18065 [Nocardia terpenica]|uniref:hypothetical protein n=1 Tax=Nocardia terpenica TaxID=455432 RepID=UPI002FE15D9F